MIDISNLATHFDPQNGTIEGFPTVVRRLSDLRGSFADEAAYQRKLITGDPVIYSVAKVEYLQGDGQLAYALGRILPGKIGREYFLTKGHYHAWRPAAEIYVCLTGQGRMILEGQDGNLNRMVPLIPNSAVYVPGFTAHRTVNTGLEPLVYLGIYPAQAGHDYASISEQNFRYVIAEIDGKPTFIDRIKYMERYLT